MKKIAFVCTGNINRSSAFEIVMKDNFSNTGEFFSYGLNESSKERKRMRKRMRDILLERGYLRPHARDAGV